MSVPENAPKSKPHRTRARRSKPLSRFRTQVPDELVDQLIGRLLSLIARGLELLLKEPSEIAQQWRKEHSDAWFEAKQVPYILLWVAMLAWKTDLEGLPEHLDDGVRALLGPDFVWDPVRLEGEFARLHPRVVELAIHDALKEGDKEDPRPPEERPTPQEEYEEAIGVAELLKLFKRRFRPFLKQMDRQDRSSRVGAPRDYRTRSFLSADMIRWLLRLRSTEEMRRWLKRYPFLAGAVNFQPGQIPDKSTFSRRRPLIPFPTLLEMFHALVKVLAKMGVISGQALIIDLTSLQTYSNVAKELKRKPEERSDPEARFRGFNAADGLIQYGYNIIIVVDFKTELPIAFLFVEGNEHDAPHAVPALEQAEREHPTVVARSEFVFADGNYDAVNIFRHILQQIGALPIITKNPRNAADPETDLLTDELCVLDRKGLIHKALFRTRTGVERTNSRIKLDFNLKYHKNRGFAAVRLCAITACLCLLAVAVVAMDTGHPDKIRRPITWVMPL